MNRQILHVVNQYIEAFPDEAAQLAPLQKQLVAGEKLADRKNFTGHITGAALVLSPDHSKLLMVHHRFLDRWLQPGGHWEVDEPDPLAAARREAEEETGVRIGNYLAMEMKSPLVPLEIGVHRIPANDAKQEPAHWHYDFRYAFEAVGEKLDHDMVETKGAAWWSLGSPKTNELAIVLDRIRQYVLHES